MQVSIKYVGTLQDGKIVESNVGEKPYKFKLGKSHSLLHYFEFLILILTNVYHPNSRCWESNSRMGCRYLW